ncbi:hypothetical protein [Streptomyces sp. NPDC021020]|uniref:hypothetical protein n=1 Tax=Streptomyces sp. NPDC021020 TaxID=3365109 RepID=UPI0037B0B7D6
MTAGSAATASAFVFVWLGMVLAVSFLEAPLKFRAPGVTVPIGLGIGRLVFRALNAVEAALAVAVLATLASGGAPAAPTALAAAVAALLAVQVGVVRRRLARRSDRVLAGEVIPRSRGHLAYVAFEVVKVALLVALGVAAAAA